MKPSCIIPTRNRREMVLRAIESAKNQKGYDVEVVVVDDGSTDGTAEAVKIAFPGAKVVRTEAAGPGEARNAGCGEASGDVFLFLDSDDVWLPNHVGVLMSLVRDGFPVAYGVTRTRNLVSGEDFLVPVEGEGMSGDCFSRLAGWCFLVPSSVAITRRAFDAVGGFGPGTLGEDWAFFLRLSAVFPFAFSSETITERFLHPGSLCCFMENGGSAADALEHVRRALEDCGASRARDFERLRLIEELVEKEGEQWQTVQDWYMSMKRRGLA